MPALPDQRSFRVVLACWALILCFACACYRVRTFDTFFHLATGRFIVANGFVPARDPFSFTFRGAPWLNHSFGFQWALAQLHAAFGFAGISVLQGVGACVLAATGLGALRARPALLVPGSLLVVLPALAFREVLEARPHVFGFCALALSLSLVLDVEREPSRRIRLIGLIGLYAIWVTCHGSHLLAFVLLGFSAVSAALDRDLHRLAVVAVCAACMLALAAWLAPHAFAQGGEHLASDFLESSVEEWYPVSFPELLSHPSGWVFLAAFLTSLMGAVLALREQPEGLADKPRAVLLLALFAALAFTSRRMIALFLFGAAPLWLPYAAYVLSRASERLRVPTALRLGAAPALLSVLSALPVLTPGPFVFGAGLAEGRFPERAVDALARTGRVKRVYNAYNFGGYLMWRGVPEAGVFVDGRAITLYPAAFLVQFERAYDDPRLFEAMAHAYAVDGVLMPTQSARVQRLRAYLTASPRWQHTFEDDVAFVFELR